MTAEPDMHVLRAWIGRRNEDSATIDAGQAARMAATLGHPVAPTDGQALPPLWHWAYFTPTVSRSLLGPDGHPRLGDVMPPIALPRRMWASGAVRFASPLRIGCTATRTTEIVDIIAKAGSDGPLVFVTLRHTISSDGTVAIEENQTLVYRGANNGPSAAGAPASAEQPADWRDDSVFDPTLLFRYSALTFNAHRIHYDLPYAQHDEGYAGLVVQGPLAATCLADRLIARRDGMRLAAFDFRGRQPLIAEPRAARLCGKAQDADGHYALWAESAYGAVTMTATAMLEAGDAD